MRIPSPDRASKYAPPVHQDRQGREPIAPYRHDHGLSDPARHREPPASRALTVPARGPARRARPRGPLPRAARARRSAAGAVARCAGRGALRARRGAAGRRVPLAGVPALVPCRRVRTLGGRPGRPAAARVTAGIRMPTRRWGVVSPRGVRRRLRASQRARGDRPCVLGRRPVQPDRRPKSATATLSGSPPRCSRARATSRRTRVSVLGRSRLTGAWPPSRGHD